ncbi:MAG: aldehyde dehydrogenase family protein, partial [Thaumarchaeota archaeon]|nr:aldehyde dehydrogenase family protein [Nitrososphaerota archaeon]
MLAANYLDKEGVCKNLIGGEWVHVETDGTFEDTNPADTRQVLARFPKANLETVRSAIDAAWEAQKKWGEVTSPERSKVLFKAAEILEAEREDYAKLITTEEGKTLAESRGEVTRTLSVLRFFSGSGYRLYGITIPSEDPKVQIYTRREPLGVVSIITPWNFPILLACWKIAPALISGNSVVFKPASYTPIIGLRLVELFERAGLSKGVLNFITGSGEVLGDEMVRNPKVSAVSFTGSNPVGQSIQSVASSRKSPSMLRVQLEMGGKNPTVVMDDSDLENASDIVMKAAFGVTGQSCSATERVIVHTAVYDAFLKRLVEKASRIKIGNGMEGADMGPLVSMVEKKKVLGFFEAGRGEGARVAYGGAAPQDEEHAHGAFVQPTI